MSSPSSSRRPDSGNRPFRSRGRFPRRFNFNRGFHHNSNRGGYHKDYHKGGEYYKPDHHHHKDYHRYHHDSHYSDKYGRHHSSHKRYSSRSRSRSRSPSDKIFERKRHRSRSFSRSRSRSRSKSDSRSRSRSRSRSHSRYRSRSKTRSDSRSRSRTPAKYRRSYTPGNEGSERKASIERQKDPSNKNGGTAKTADTFRPILGQKKEARAVKDMPLYSDEELELTTKKDSFSEKLRLSLLERAMTEKKKLGLVNPGTSEKSSALEALQCYSPPSPFSDHGRDRLEAASKERHNKALLERQVKAMKPILKAKPEKLLETNLSKSSISPDIAQPPSPLKSSKADQSALPDIPGLGFSSIDDEEDFLYGRGSDDKNKMSATKSIHDNSSNKKSWLQSEKKKSSTWSDEEDLYGSISRDRRLDRISRSPSPVKIQSSKVKAKMFDLGELFTPALKSDSKDRDKEIGNPKELLEDIPLMINRSRPEETKIKADNGKSFSIWDSPESKPPVKTGKSSPQIKRIVPESSLSPFRNRQGNWRPESQPTNADKNPSIMSEDSIPLSIEIKRTIKRVVGSPHSDRSKHSDSYHNVEVSRDQKRLKRQQPAEGGGKSQYKLTDLCEGLKSGREKSSMEAARDDKGKRFDNWESTVRQVGSEDRRDTYDKEHHNREPSPLSTYKKASRQYSSDHSPSYDSRRRSPYRSPSYSPYRYSPRRRSPYRESPHRSKYYSPYRSPGRNYDRSPSPGFYNRRERYRSPGRRSHSYSPRRIYDRKFSRSPTPPRKVPLLSDPPDIPLPPQPPLPHPSGHFPQTHYYDPNIGPPTQYPPLPTFPPSPVGYPMMHGLPPPFQGSYPPNIPQAPYPYPPLPVSGPIPFPPPPTSERANLKVIPIQSSDPVPEQEPPKLLLKPLNTQERERLGKEKDEKFFGLQMLKIQLEQLQKLQGEMMRKKQRQKDGHKDPLIMENTKLQEEIRNQITSSEETLKELCKKLGEPTPDFAAIKTEQSTSQKDDKKEDQIKKEEEDEDLSVSFEYFDPGNHWCKTCNQFLPNAVKFLLHLQTQDHIKKMDTKSRPWASMIPKKAPNRSGKSPVVTPLKGAHYLLPISGFYCSLCNSLMGDAACAEEHLRTLEHNRNFTKHTLLSPQEERRWNKEKNIAITLLKKEEKRQLKKMELERLQTAAKKKKNDSEAERRHKELIKSEKEKQKSTKELEDSQPHHKHNRNESDSSVEKANIKLTLLTKNDAKKKPAPIILIGKAPNFKPKDDGQKGVGISKLQVWKKTDSENKFPVRKVTKDAHKEPHQKIQSSNCDSVKESSSGEITSAFIGPVPSEDVHLIHGPQLPPDSFDSISLPPKSFPQISLEEQNDLHMLGIDREDFFMIAAPRAPPVTSFAGSIAPVKSKPKGKVLVKVLKGANPILATKKVLKSVKTGNILKTSLPSSLESPVSDPVGMDIVKLKETAEQAKKQVVVKNAFKHVVKRASNKLGILNSKGLSKAPTTVVTPKLIEEANNCKTKKALPSNLNETPQSNQRDSVFQHFKIIEQIGETLVKEVSEDNLNNSPSNVDHKEGQHDVMTVYQQIEDSVDDDMKLMLEDDDGDESNASEGTVILGEGESTAD